MPAKLRVLILEDRAADAELVLHELRRAGYEPEWKRVETEQDYLSQLDQGYEIILADYNLPEFDGLRALELLKERGLDIPFIIVSGTIGEDKAVAAMKAGANDYVMKDRLVRLGTAVERGLRDTVERRERKRAEEEVRSLQRRIEFILGATKTRLDIIDSEFNIHYIDPEWGKVYGDHTGRKCYQYFMGRDEVCPGCGIVKALETRSIVITEEKLPRENNRPIQVTTIPFQDETGKWLVAEVNVDITERKRTEEVLRETNEYLQNLFNSASAPIVVWDPQFRITAFNRAFEAVSGWNARDVIGKSIEILFSPAQVESSMDRIRKTLTGERWKTVEILILHRDGSVRTVLWNSATVIAADGKTPLATIAQGQDITERKRAERVLRDSEERYRQLFEDALDGIALVDAQTGMILDCNPALLKVVGRERHEVVGQSQRILHPPSEALGEVTRSFEQHRQQKAGQTLEVPILTKAGEVRTAEIKAAVHELQGRKVMVGIFRDITEHKRLEEQFRQAQKMEAVGRLAGGVAHDFNNLLFVINGRAELAMDGLKAHDPLRAQLKLIHETGGRAANLTRQLLAFSRRQTLQPRILDLNAVVTDMSKMLFRLIREDITMKMVLDPALRLTKADPGQVEQVLMNLVVNARDAMPQGGKLVIETANVELGEAYCRTHADAKPGHYVMLAVSDTGCGMDDSVKARIFEPFFTTKELGQGTGLGLATVYGIVKQSDGHIAVYSEVGKGTTFKIYLPETAAKPARASHVSKTVVPRGTETILLVEDEEEVRILAHELLESNGYKVLLAGNGIEALSVCKKRKGKIDMIITDVVMPRMNGPEMAQRASGLCPGIKVLFISGYTDGAVSSHGVLSPETNHLQKPFTPGHLARKVREVLDFAAETAATRR